MTTTILAIGLVGVLLTLGLVNSKLRQIRDRLTKLNDEGVEINIHLDVRNMQRTLDELNQTVRDLRDPVSIKFKN